MRAKDPEPMKRRVSAAIEALEQAWWLDKKQKLRSEVIDVLEWYRLDLDHLHSLNAQVEMMERMDELNEQMKSILQRRISERDENLNSVVAESRVASRQREEALAAAAKKDDLLKEMEAERLALAERLTNVRRANVGRPRKHTLTNRQIELLTAAYNELLPAWKDAKRTYAENRGKRNWRAMVMASDRVAELSDDRKRTFSALLPRIAPRGSSKSRPANLALLHAQFHAGIPTIDVNDESTWYSVETLRRHAFPDGTTGTKKRASRQ